MPKFAFTAIDAEGKEIKGTLEADTESEAMHEVGRKGLFITEIHKAGLTDGLRGIFEADRQRRQQEEAKRQSEVRKKYPRQRLVVHFADGRVDYGVAYHLNTKERGFHLERTDKAGAALDERVPVEFSDIKAIFFVRTYDGKFDKRLAKREVQATGQEMIVEFKDGEVLHGQCVHPYRPDDPRFYIVPIDAQSNNLNILIERDAVRTVCSPEEYERRKKEARAAQTKEPGTPGGLSQEETLGDFYFETRNYPGALEQYNAATAKEGTNPRLRKKILVTKYNIAMQYIKRREYPMALQKMNEVLDMDPRNAHALKKVKKLKKILDHMEQGGPAFEDDDEL